MVSLKKFIWDKLDKGEYITDSILYKFKNKEPNYYLAEVYKKLYYNFHKAIDKFSEKINRQSIIHNYSGRYSLSLNGENEWYKIPKDYYEHLKNKGVKIK